MFYLTLVWFWVWFFPAKLLLLATKPKLESWGELPWTCEPTLIGKWPVWWSSQVVTTRETPKPNMNHRHHQYEKTTSTSDSVRAQCTHLHTLFLLTRSSRSALMKWNRICPQQIRSVVPESFGDCVLVCLCSRTNCTQCEQAIHNHPIKHARKTSTTELSHPKRNRN